MRVLKQLEKVSTRLSLGKSARKVSDAKRAVFDLVIYVKPTKVGETVAVFL